MRNYNDDDLPQQQLKPIYSLQKYAPETDQALHRNTVVSDI